MASFLAWRQATAPTAGSDDDATPETLEAAWEESPESGAEAEPPAPTEGAPASSEEAVPPEDLAPEVTLAPRRAPTWLAGVGALFVALPTVAWIAAAPDVDDSIADCGFLATLT